jgi:hypothetical protein
VYISPFFTAMSISDFVWIALVNREMDAGDTLASMQDSLAIQVDVTTKMLSW